MSNPEVEEEIIVDDDNSINDGVNVENEEN